MLPPKHFFCLPQDKIKLVSSNRNFEVSKSKRSRVVSRPKRILFGPKEKIFVEREAKQERQRERSLQIH